MYVPDWLLWALGSLGWFLAAMEYRGWFRWFCVDFGAVTLVFAVSILLRTLGVWP